MRKANTSTDLKSTECIRFEFKELGEFEWWLFLHNSFVMPSGSSWDRVQVKPKRQYIYTWDLGAFRLLQSPYPTDCRDYRSSSKYLSRRDCIRKCKLNASNTTCNAIYEGIDIQRDDPPVLFDTNGTCAAQIDFDAICTKKCSNLDCAIDYYELISQHDTNYTQCNGTCARLDLTIPTKPETAYYHEPRIELVEFICYLASTANMWFGLSIYSLNYLFIVCRNKIVDHGRKISKTRKLSDFIDKKRILNRKSSNMTVRPL